MSKSSTACASFASPHRAKSLYLVNECAALNNRGEEAHFHAALEAGGVTISKLAMVLGCCRSRAARLVAGIRRPTLAERTVVVTRWGAKCAHGGDK